MATFKAVVLEHHKKADGSYNVKIRVTHKRKVRYLSTGIFVFKEDITRSMNIRNKEKNDALDEIVDQYYSCIDKLGVNSGFMDVDEIIDYINSQVKNEFENNNQRIGFFDFTYKMIDKKQQSTSVNYKSMLNSLDRFSGNQITFSDINVSFLNKYEKWLRNTGTGGRGVSLYMGLIRAVFNEAMRELNDYERDKMPIKGSPFSKYKIPKEPPTPKRAIEIDKICQIYNYESELKRVNFARDMFILSFFLIGMNSADLYECTNYKNGRITYNRMKTKTRRDDKAEFSVLVPTEADTLIEKYKDPTGNRVFRFYLDFADTNTFNQSINKGLKVIGKCIGIDNLTFYAARHSWATIARNDLRIDKYTVHEALNHVDEKTKITDIYTKKDWSYIDDANRKVIDYMALNRNKNL